MFLINLELIKSLPYGAEVVTYSEGDSMYPVIKKGDKLIIKKTKFEKVKVGSIIALQIATTENIIAHRVKRIINNSNPKKKYLITQGDNRKEEDQWIVTKENFLGSIKTVETPK